MTEQTPGLSAEFIAQVEAQDEQAVHDWLLAYAWLGTKDEQAREVGCIMAQDGWRHALALADKFAGAQDEPGPAAFNEGVGFALSAEYECHGPPHLDTCPRHTS